MFNKIKITICCLLFLLSTCATTNKFSRQNMEPITPLAESKEPTFFFESMMYPYFSKAERKLLDEVHWQIFKEDSAFVYYGFYYHPNSTKRNEYILSDGIFKTKKLDLLQAIPNYNSINADSLFHNFIVTSHICTHCKIDCAGEYSYFDFNVLPDMFTISFKSNCKSFLGNIESTHTVFMVGIDKISFKCKCISGCK
jgi:hypothetical protein